MSDFDKIQIIQHNDKCNMLLSEANELLNKVFEYVDFDDNITDDKIFDLIRIFDLQISENTLLSKKLSLEIINNS